MTRIVVRSGLALLLLTITSPLSAQTTFTVTSTLGGADASPGDGLCADSGGDCTLLAAIEEANAHPGRDSIHFAIPSAGPHTIRISDRPHRYDVLESVVIDGYTQPGASPNTNPILTSSNATLMVFLDWTCTSGLHVLGDDSVVRGLESNRALGVRGDRIVIRGNEFSKRNAQPGCPDYDGIQIRGHDAVIGGIQPHEFNVISGKVAAIRIGGSSSESVGADIRGNYIGTNAAGTVPAPNERGIVVQNARDMIIAGNVIAYSEFEGVLIPRGSGIQVSQNSIHSNGGLGIDLGGDPIFTSGDGVTPNDPIDADTGPNDLLNYPTISEVWGSPAGARISYHGAPNSSLYVEVFASDECHPSGFGGGQRFVVTTGLFTDGSGNGSLSTTALGSLAVGEVLTVIVIDQSTGSTSEFSACARVEPRSSLIVNSTDDTDDGACTGGHCSLREALVAANDRAGPDSIHFAIPGDGVQTILTTAVLPSIDDDVVIDGYTQPGASPNTNALSMGSNAVLGVAIDGNGAPAGSNGLEVRSGKSSTIRGLAIHGFGGVVLQASAGTNAVIEGNFIGIDATGTGGGPTGSAVMLEGPHLLGGPDPSARNVIAGEVHLFQSGGVVQGNYIGTDITGARPLGVGTLRLATSVDAVIGGSGAGEGNVVAGGISDLPVNATDPVIHGNFIGTDPSGSVDLGNDGHGVHVLGGGFAIGGATPGAGNVIAHNGGAGVFVEGGALRGNAIRGNAIYDNDGLGIDLGSGSDPDGVTPNDPGDADTGGNLLQNFPELTAAYSGSTLVEGSLSSSPHTEFALDFFTNPTCDSSGHGQGRFWLGTGKVTTDAAGDASFSTALVETAGVGDQVTATATDPDGNTSEFSGCVGAQLLDLDLTVSSPRVSIDAGGVTELELTVTPVRDAFPQLVLLACQGGQTVSCSVSPSSVTPGTEPAKATVTVTAGALNSLGQASSTPPGSGAPALPWAALVVMAVVAAVRVRSATRPGECAFLAMAAAGVVLLAACGSETTTPEPVTEMITVTATSGAVSDTVSVEVTVRF